MPGGHKLHEAPEDTEQGLLAATSPDVPVALGGDRLKGVAAGGLSLRLLCSGLLTGSGSNTGSRLPVTGTGQAGTHGDLGAPTPGGQWARAVPRDEVAEQPPGSPGPRDGAAI